MEIVVSILLLSALMLVVGVSEPVADKLRLPHTVFLALLGIMISVSGAFLLGQDTTFRLLPFADSILEISVESQVFLYVFLPTLLFQATLDMDLRRMMDDWVPILVMAVVAVIVSTLAVGYSLSWVSGLPTVACLLIGAIVSTTDPSAVVSIFRSISAPKRLSNIIEGESLLNDAAAIALFGLFLGMTIAGAETPSFSSAMTQIPMLVAGGAISGWLVARSVIYLMSLFPGHVHAQISLSVALPYLTYVIAEQFVGASGVIAVVAAGLTLNVLGHGKLSPMAWGSLKEVWEILSYWSGALIFIVAAFFIPRLLDGAGVADLLLVGVVVVSAFGARLFTLFCLLPAMSALRLSPAVDRGYRKAILWGGLRGAVTLVLALAVVESPLVSTEVKHAVGILATGFTLFTLLAQGTTLRWVVKKLKLDQLNQLDEALARQVVAVSLQSVREDISDVTTKYGLSQAIVRSEAKDFGQRLEAAVKAAEDCSVLQERDRITLSVIALAAYEKEITLDLMREGTISTHVSGRMLLDTRRLLEAARSNGRFGYGRATRQSLAYGAPYRFAVALRRWFGVQYPVAAILSARFERLLALRIIVQDLSGFVDGRVRRIHGRRVTDLLHSLLKRRSDQIDTALEGLRLQYPGYAEELEKRMIRRVSLRHEEREIDSLRQESLIGSELHAVLKQGIDERRQKVDRRPQLDVVVSKHELMRQIPSFQDLDDAELGLLEKSLRTRNVDEGDFVFRKDTGTQSIFFIVNGAVELSTANEPLRLGRGEVFGKIGSLAKRGAFSDVKAIAPTTLLVLEAKKLQALLKRNQAIRELLDKSGVSLA